MSMEVALPTGAHLRPPRATPETPRPLRSQWGGGGSGRGPMTGVWSLLLKPFSASPRSGGRLMGGPGKFAPGRKDNRHQGRAGWGVGTGLPGGTPRVRGAGSGEAGCGASSRFPSPSLAMIVWGSGRLWRLRWGPGGQLGNCQDRPSGSRSPHPP